MPGDGGRGADHVRLHPAHLPPVRIGTGAVWISDEGFEGW